MSARVIYDHNLNVRTGLTSNHVYSTHTDYLGYLWICTDNGLFRYNGYDLKKYSLAEGLPNDDTWSVTEDKMHRLWVHAIAPSMGYILNGRFHTAYKDKHLGTLYPVSIYKYNDGIFFVQSGDESGYFACYEYHDTLRIYPYRFPLKTFFADSLLVIETPKELRVFRIGPKLTLSFRNAVPNLLSWQPRMGYTIFHDHFIGTAYRRGVDTFYSLDLRSGALLRILLTDSTGQREETVLIDSAPGYLSVITRRNIYKFDSALHLMKREPIGSLTSEGSHIINRVVWASSDSAWKEIVGTRTHGVFLSTGTDQHFDRLDVNDLSDYKCVGRMGDSMTYWLDMSRNVLLDIHENGRVTVWPDLPEREVRNITPYTPDRCLVMSAHSLRTLFLADYRRRRIDPVPFSNVNANKVQWPGWGVSPRNIVLGDSGMIYIAGGNFLRGRIVDHEIHYSVMDSGGRYYYTAYDSSWRGAWAYNNNGALFCPAQGDIIRFSDSLYKCFGIKNIEKLIPYRNGTLFLKDNSRFYEIDLVRHMIRERFRNYNFVQAVYSIHQGTFIIAGKFGVLFAKINEPDSMAICYPNIKNGLYHRALDIETFHKKIILNTDRGTYMVPIPPDSMFRYPERNEPWYKTIISYRDTLYNVQEKHQFAIVAGSDRMQVDVINPQGNGALRLSYYIKGIDPGWQEMNGNEIKLPKLSAGNTYALFIKASDDVWNSTPLRLTLYMVPLWWQTPVWQAIFWIGGILGVLGILLIVMVLTRNRVASAAEKKQYMTMLELRSIYAQLNPHFIFNTLNTALYFIKKKQIDDATVHVTTFSHLLRSYIDASRSRLISVPDEIINLRNYITLQQKRFEEAFSFEVTADDATLERPVYIPSLLLQPMVENAINHGLVPKGGGGWLKVDFRRHPDGSLVCTIEDNGIGRKRSQELKSGIKLAKPSHGSRLIQELTDAFNKYERLGIEITYLDKEPPLSGTLVTIFIKRPYESQPVHVPHR